MIDFNAVQFRLKSIFYLEKGNRFNKINWLVTGFQSPRKVRANGVRCPFVQVKGFWVCNRSASSVLSLLLNHSPSGTARTGTQETSLGYFSLQLQMFSHSRTTLMYILINSKLNPYHHKITIHWRYSNKFQIIFARIHIFIKFIVITNWKKK